MDELLSVLAAVQVPEAIARNHPVAHFPRDGVQQSFPSNDVEHSANFVLLLANTKFPSHMNITCCFLTNVNLVSQALRANSSSRRDTTDKPCMSKFLRYAGARNAESRLTGCGAAGHIIQFGRKQTRGFS